MKERFDRGDIRRMNAVSALNQLRRGGPMSRAQIAERLGLTRATVSNIVADLIGVSLVTESEFEEGGLGRRGMLLELNPACGSMIAVELDIDRVAVVLANVGMDFLWRGEVALARNVSPEEGMRSALELVEEAMEEGESRLLRCLGICVAWAGLVERKSGELALGPTSGWAGVAIKQNWEARFGVPVFVENEAHAGAIAAHHLGEPRGEADLIYLSLGVGLSAGVFVDGELLRGRQGFAGQVGHVPFVAGGELCGCGKCGCWVTEIGASGVLRKLERAGVGFGAGEGGDLGWIERICDLAAAGDERVLAALAEEGRQIGEGLVQLVQVFNPSRVVIGGHLRRLVKLCEGEIRRALEAGVLFPMRDGLTVAVSESEEDQLMGCLATVFDAVMKNPMGRSGEW